MGNDKVQVQRSAAVLLASSLQDAYHRANRFFEDPLAAHFNEARPAGGLTKSFVGIRCAGQHRTMKET